MSPPRTTSSARTTVPEYVALTFFFLTHLQVIILKSYVPVVAGLKADVYSAVLSVLALAGCLIIARKDSFPVSPMEVIVSLGLLCLALISGAVSATPWSSSVWALSLAAYCLGGFWCTRILLNSDSRKAVFVWLNISILSGALGLALWGYYFHGVVHYFVDDLHQFVSMVLILSFSALSLLGHRRPLVKLLGAVALLECYIALYVCAVGGVELGVLIPAVMLIPAFFISMARPTSRYGLVAVLLVVAIITAHYVSRVSSEKFSGTDYQAERLEFYTLSVHVMQKHPWWGIGLRTPRDEALSDYKVWHPRLTEKRFAEEARRLVTSQNIFVTFMVGFGVPFGILYLTAIIALYIRLTRATWRPPPNAGIPSMALLIPVTGCILHFSAMDIMLMPQIAWGFHVLLGLIPQPSKADDHAPKGKPLRFSKWLKGTVATVLTVIVGIVIGTHPALAPARLPSMEEVHEYVARLPILSAVLKARTTQEPQKEVAQGLLRVNLPEGWTFSLQWAVLFLLDNSQTMTAAEEPWTPSRLKAAMRFVEVVGREMPGGSRIGVRAFAKVGPFVKGMREFSPRVSRLLLPWQETPVKGFPPTLFENFPPGTNNLCIGLQFAAGRDFSQLDREAPSRIALVTDHWDACPIPQAIDLIRTGETNSQGLAVDLIAMGDAKGMQNVLSSSIRETRGQIVMISHPDDVSNAADAYLGGILATKTTPLLIVGEQGRFEIVPGRSLSVPAGRYMLKIPQFSSLKNSSQTPQELIVKPGTSSVIDISVQDGRLFFKTSDEKDSEGS